MDGRRRAATITAGAQRRPELRALAAPLQLVAARARCRPTRWLWPVLGLTLAVAFACGVAAESTIAGDRAARATLAALDPLQRAVTVTYQGPAGAAVDRRARALLARLGLPAVTRTVLLNPVRLSGRVVRLAAVEPAGTAVEPAGAVVGPVVGRSVGRCRPRACPVLLVGGTVGQRALRAPGVRITIAGDGRLRSAAPLGFVPTAHGQPLLVSGDVTGVAALPALSSVYRTDSWVSVPQLTGLHSWELADFERRLTRAQAGLAPAGGLSLSAPTDALRSARDRAGAAPRRLLPAGGGALAVLAMFLILAAYGLRRDQQVERERLRAAGARAGQLVAFSLAEAAWVAAVAVAAGAALGIGVAALLAAQADLPAAAVLSHSLLTASGAAALAGGWVIAVAVIGAVLLASGARLADGLAVAAAAALALALTVGGGNDGTLALLAPPLACLAAAGLVYRAAGVLLRGGERWSRGGPPVIRLALVGLARSPVAPALAVAFVAVSTGLAGFALGYRATLQRGAVDEATQAVGLDARVGESADFARPLEMATASRWRALAGPGSRVLAVRRTDASLPLNGDTTTLPVLGVPADGLTAIRGWRAGDGSAPPATLAQRLAPRGPVRTPGPTVPDGARRLTVRVQAPHGEVQLSADLRGAQGAITQVALGSASPRPLRARARVPHAWRPLRAGGARDRTAHRGAGPQRSPERREPRGRHAVDDDRAPRRRVRRGPLAGRLVARVAGRRCRRGRRHGTRRHHAPVRRQRAAGRAAAASAQRRPSGAGADRSGHGRRSRPRRGAPPDRRRGAGHGARRRHAAALSDDRGRWTGIRHRRRSDPRRRAGRLATRPGPDRRAVDLDREPAPAARRATPAAAEPADRQLPRR